MKRIFQWLLLSIIGAFVPALIAHAAPTPVLITQIQAGAAAGEPSAASQEFISLYNTTDHDINITNWCLVNKTPAPIACLTPTEPGQAFYLAGHSFMTLASTSFKAAHLDSPIDMLFDPLTPQSGSITGSGDTITLRNDNQEPVDIVQWTIALGGGSIWQRQTLPADTMAFIDTDTVIDTTKMTDFAKLLGLVIPSSGFYEEMTIIDQCSNIDEVQQRVPSGMTQTESGDCVVDMCPALEGVQTTLPPDYTLTSTGVCVPRSLPLKITELLPNASGSDEGAEFIELFNPTGSEADLTLYTLAIGVNGEKTVGFREGTVLEAGQYRAFYNSELPFSLINTTGKVALLGPDGEVVSQTDPYSDPPDGAAWALFDATWRYTNQPTGGEENRPSVAAPLTSTNSALQPCAANQYRSPETNRCRLLVTVTSTVTPCKEGQYRSEETNRCRSIAVAASTAKPCADDQFRNPASGRCKKIASSDEVALADCGEGRERNPATGRCRNVLAKTIPQAAFAVEPIKDTGKAFVGWWILGGVGALALGYAGWEWRREFVGVVGRVSAIFTRHH